MASKRNNLRNPQYSPGIAYLEVLDPQLVSQTVSNLLEATSLHPEVVSTLHEVLSAFLIRVHNDVANLKSVYSLREYYDACKKRYDDLSSMCSLLLTADDENGVLINRINKGGEKRIYLIGRRNRKICITSNDKEFFVHQRRPGAYKILFQVVPEIVEYLNQLLLTSFLDVEMYRSNMRDLSLVITTIGKIYEDIRGKSDFRLDESQKTIARMSRDHKLDHSSEWWALFQRFIEDIEFARANPFKAKTYVKDIARAIPNELPKFDYKDFHLSFKKTGTLFDGQPLPGLYASIVETDQVDTQDDLIGYTSMYNQYQDVRVEQANRKSVLIPQHKLPLRLIHMASNPIQDRCTFYHNRMMNFLNQLRVDCTIDQSKGVSFARLVSSPKYRSRHKNNIYCLDISKATDTLNQEFQRLCVQILFGSEHADNWSKLVTGPSKFIERGKTLAVFNQLCGQPQGFKSSFPAFAWVHHVIMRLVMLKHGLEDTEPTAFYRVLGDDSIISHTDMDGSILQSYLDACQFVNWECHESKGYLYRYASDDCAFAEFAKVRILDGEYCTPVPIRLLMNSIKNPLDYICYQWWLTKYFNTVSIETVARRLIRKFPDNITDEVAEAILTLNGAKIGIFAEFSTEDPEDLTDEQLTLTFLAYMKSKLRQTLLNQFIPDNLLTLSDRDKTEIVSPFLESKLEAKLLNLIENSDHKYVQLLEKNQDIINTLASIFDETKVSLSGVIALNLSDKDKDSVYTACELLIGLEQYDVLPPFDEVKETLTNALEVLNRYNVRSDRSAAKIESELLVTFCEDISQFIEHHYTLV